MPTEENDETSTGELPQTLLELSFDSAVIVASSRPRIEFPSIDFQRKESPKERVSKGPRLEVKPASLEEMQQGYLGWVSPEHVVLVLPPRDFESLRKRVRAIREEPLRFAITANPQDLITRARYAEQVVLPRHSQVVGGAIDFEIDDAERQSG